MNTTDIKRIFSGGAKNFARGGSVSFATVLIMTTTLIIIGALIFLSAVLSHTLEVIRDKVDVNVYFTTDAPEEQILALQRNLEALPEVESVTYTTREEALEAFRVRHADDALTLQALDELGGNPLGASIAIKADNPELYEGIVDYLTNQAAASEIIDRVNYYQNKVVIDRLANAIGTTERAGFIIVLMFAIASIVITFATIRLAIHTSRDEIAVMKLVGASNMYVRGPFIIAGVIAGIIGALITLVLFYPVSWYVGSALSGWLGGFNLFKYFTDNFVIIFLILMGSGIVLGGVASWLAVRRYLKI
jgi:cell division transport system permease protein